MSLKVYNGIKFKSKDVCEIVSQLYSIKKQAIENSNKHILNSYISVYNIVSDKDKLMNLETKHCEFWLLRVLQENLRKQYRSVDEPSFLFSVVVIPWKDGNVYGIYYDDSIKENSKLLFDNNIAEDFYYQNQTDAPDEDVISAEDWENRCEIWNEIFDVYFTPAEAGLVYDIVSASDLDFSTTDELVKKIRDSFYPDKGWKYIIHIESEDGEKDKDAIDKIISDLKSITDITDVYYFGIGSYQFIVCEFFNEAVGTKIEEYCSGTSMLTLKEKNNVYIKK